MQIHNHTIEINTRAGFSVFDLTPRLRELVSASGISQGYLLISSRHTTTAITVNENEDRLLRDLRAFFAKLVPADTPYLHNDIHLRDCPADEPENAHSHILAILLGATETVPVACGELVLGEWQSVLLAELDGPRTRQVSAQVVGA